MEKLLQCRFTELSVFCFCNVSLLACLLCLLIVLTCICYFQGDVGFETFSLSQDKEVWLCLSSWESNID